MTYLTMRAMQPSQDKGRLHLEINYELLSDLFIDWYKGAPDRDTVMYCLKQSLTKKLLMSRRLCLKC